MADNQFFNQRKPESTWLTKLFLYLSFAWISVYPAISSYTTNFVLNYGVHFTNASGFEEVVSILSMGLFEWISFEIIFWLYRLVLSYKIYTFVVPLDSLKEDARTFFTYRNIFYGIIVNLCFVFPYISTYLMVIELLFTFTFMLIFAKHLCKTYSQTIIAHFVYKNFVYPFFVYEALVILFRVVGWM